MIVIVDDRHLVIDGYRSGFNREGMSSAGFGPEDFGAWINTVSKEDILSVEAFLIPDETDCLMFPDLIRNRSSAPVIAMSENTSLQSVLKLFSAGVDDVVRKPVHVKEILARVHAILSRQKQLSGEVVAGEIKVFPDGRPPVVGQGEFQLPRREYRILEHLVRNEGKRISKTQLFNVVYGLFEENVDESVVESHISKLRKKLRLKLGYDPIDSKRYMGYCLTSPRSN